MKKKNTNKLAIKKGVVTELNSQQLMSIKGGTSGVYTIVGPMSPLSCTFCVSSSNGGNDNEYLQILN